MKFLDKSYLETQFTNFADKVSDAFLRKKESKNYELKTQSLDTGATIQLQSESFLYPTPLVESTFDINGNNNLKITVNESGSINIDLVWIELSDNK